MPKQSRLQSILLVNGVKTTLVQMGEEARLEFTDNH
jgi:hypothetical protein